MHFSSYIINDLFFIICCLQVMGSEKKSVNNKTNLYSEENRKSYSQALNSHLKLGNDNLMVNDKKSSKRLDCESHSMKKGPEKDQNQAYKFNFNSR